MLRFDYPYIRDELVINADVQAFCHDFVGDGPVFLIGRRVSHEVTLTPGSRPIIIVADVYDGSGGMIDASGSFGAGGAQGSDGHGVGVSGDPGGTGGHGGPGGSVTVYCRQSVNAHISVAGGWGGVGGNGGNGTDGTPDNELAGYWERVDLTPYDPFDDAYEDRWVDPVLVPGIPGGRGGVGGRGGSGGNGGTIRFTSIVDETWPTLEAPGGGGRDGGWGGWGGVFATPEDDGGTMAPSGASGDPGADGEVTYTTVPEIDFVASLRPLLGAYANYWAPFRLAVGDWLYHQPDDGPGRPSPTELAATEFRRTLELQPDNAEALRLRQQLESGLNALGLDPDLDVMPMFDKYIDAFTGFGGLALNFVTSGTNEIIGSLTLHNLSSFADEMRLQAVAAQDFATDQLGIATTEHQFATDEIGYAQQRLDEASADITAEIARMRQASMQSGSVIGTVAEVAVAVVGVIAAVPSGGASLVAVVPAVAALASTVLQDAGPIANAVLNGSDVDVSDIEAAYKKIGKEAPAAVVAGVKSVINFVSVIEKLTASRTPDNARYVELVRRGVELTHELLLAQHRTSLAQQRVDAAQNQITRSGAVVDAAVAVRDAARAQAATLKDAGVLTLHTAGAAAAGLLGFAFRAQRAVEIYTLKDEKARLRLDTGMLHPDFVREYEEDRHSDAELVGAVSASWNGLLQPGALEEDYLSYFDNAPDSDQLRLTFAGDGPDVAALRARGRLAFRVDVDDLPDGRFDAKVIGARVALVGATHPNGQISTQLRHGAHHEQRRPDGAVEVQLLAPRTTTRQTGLTPLSGDPGFDLDAPLTDPTTFRLWGRGLCGDWELSVPDDQRQGLDLSGLTAVQVWFGYRFIG